MRSARTDQQSWALVADGDHFVGLEQDLIEHEEIRAGTLLIPSGPLGSTSAPAAWDVEDRRKKKGWAHSASELGDKLARELPWRSTGDALHPWETEVGDEVWRVRINEFPDELMYSLIIGDANAGDFHDWPETWGRTD